MTLPLLRTVFGYHYNSYTVPKLLQSSAEIRLQPQLPSQTRKLGNLLIRRRQNLINLQSRHETAVWQWPAPLHNVQPRVLLTTVLRARFAPPRLIPLPMRIRRGRICWQVEEVVGTSTHETSYNGDIPQAAAAPCYG